MISPPSANQLSTDPAPSVVGFIDIDIDRNPATGGSAPWGGPLVGGNNWINFFIPPNPGTPSIPAPYNVLIATGDEFFVDIGSELFKPGFVDVIDTNTNNVFATVRIDFTPTGFSVTVPFVGTPPDWTLNFDVLVGNFAVPTDRAPNGAVAATSVLIPEPASWLLFGTGMLGAVGWAWRRRRAGRLA